MTQPHFLFAPLNRGLFAAIVLLTLVCVALAAVPTSAAFGVDGDEINDGEQFGFVRNARLTGRGRISFAGEVKEREDDAIVWQLNGPAIWDSDSKLSGELGLIYRRVEDLFFSRAALLGANAFLDYADTDGGDSWRYSLGGEIRTGFLDFYGNYHVPITEDRHSEGIVHYNPEGYEAEINIGVPGADWLAVVGEYYRYEGKGYDMDGPAADETGKGFGFRLRPYFFWEFRWGYNYPDSGDREADAVMSFSIPLGGHSVFDENSRPFGGNFNPRNHFYDL